MLPSRGLRPAILNAHRSVLSQNSIKSASRQKKFSTASALTSRGGLSQKPNSLISSSWQGNGLRTPATLFSISALRYNSTSQTPLPTPPNTNASELPSFDELTSQLSNTELSSLTTERIGWLRDLGLDYGWGPTSMLEWTLEHIHVYSGMPWWSSVMATAVLVRVVCFPLYIKMTETVAKQTALAPILKPLQEQQARAIKAQDQAGMQLAMNEIRSVYRTSGIKLRYTFIGPVLQGVLGYCTFKLTRAMANLPVPGLETGGFLWLTDLTVADPYFIAPVTTAFLMHLVGRRGGESGATQLNETQKKIFLYALPGVVAVATCWLPAITQISFFTASSISMVQSIAFRNPTVRSAIGLTPIYNAPTATPKIINTTGSSKANYGTSSRINMAPRYEAPNATGSINAQSVVEKQPPRSNLQKIVNAPFEGLSKYKKEAIDWAKSTGFSNNSKEQAKSGKRGGALAGRRK